MRNEFLCDCALSHCAIYLAPLKLLAEKHKLRCDHIPPKRMMISPEKPWRPGPPFNVRPDENNSNHLLVTASFGRILPDSLLELFPKGQRLNVHPSLLPAYRGPAPIQHAIMNGDMETGVCVIEMLKRGGGIDTGEIWGQQRSVGVFQTPIL